MADDNDFEAELLDLAGRGASSKKRVRDSDESSENSDDDGPKRSRRKGGPSKQQRGGKRTVDTDSEDDPDEEAEFSDEFGSDLYGDDEDRARLEAMTELEREMILADRAEKRDKARQRREILQKAKGADKSQDARAGQRSSARQKKPSGKETAIKKIEAARKRQSKGAKSSKGSRRGRYGSDEDASGGDESEAEYDEGSEESDASSEGEGRRRRPTTRSSAGATTSGDERRGAGLDDDDEEDEPLPGVRRHAHDAGEDDVDVGVVGRGRDDAYMDDDELADHAELRSIQLTRSQLEAMFDKPFFEGDGLTGALVRIAYGQTLPGEGGNPTPQYWMMQITHIKETSNGYPFGTVKGVRCFKKLELKDGAKVLRVLPMSSISNQTLTDAEMDRFARHASRVNDRPITKQQAEEIKLKIQAAINYRWDSAKVREMLAKKRESGALPVNLTAEKARLQRLLDGEKGRQPPDYDKIAEYESKIKAIDEQLDKSAAPKQAGLSLINQRNKAANFQQTIRNVSNRPSNAPARKGTGGDPFSRRETRPSIYWNTAGSQKPKDGSAGSVSTPTKASQSAPAAPSADTPAPLKASMARLDPVELVRMLDLNIDVAPLQDCSIVPPLHMKLLGPRWHQSLAHHTNFDMSGRTLLTVQDWHMRAQQ